MDDQNSGLPVSRPWAFNPRASNSDGTDNLNGKREDGMPTDAEAPGTNAYAPYLNARTATAEKATEPPLTAEMLLDRERERLTAESQAILDSLPKDRLYEQNSLAGWRTGIPGYDNTMDTDPMWHGLDNGEFDPPAPKPRPKLILKNGGARPPPKLTEMPQQYAAPRAGVMDDHRPSKKVIKDGQSKPSKKASKKAQDKLSTASSAEAQKKPSMESLKGAYNKPWMGSSEEDQSKSSTRQSTKQPSPMDSRHPSDPPDTMNPNWATIKGPSKYLQEAIIAKNAIQPENSTASVHHGRAQQAISDRRSQDATGSGPNQDASEGGRAQDAIAAAARADPRRQFSIPLRDTIPPTQYTAPQQPADKFRADNRTAIPRGAAANRDDRGYIPVSVFVRLAEENRERERDQAELEDRAYELRHGTRAPSRTHYATHGTHAFPLPYNRPTPMHDYGTQTGDAAYTTAPAPSAQVSSTGSFVPLLGADVPDLFRAARGFERVEPMVRSHVYPGDSPTVNPDNLSQRSSALRGSGSMASMNSVPTQQVTGQKRKSEEPQAPPPSPV